MVRKAKRKKVLFFVSPYFGGASRMTITIAKMLDTAKYNPVFIVYGEKIQEIQNYIPDGYEIKLLKISSIWDFLTFKMVNLFRREKPDIVFGSFRIINFRIALAAKIVGGIKIVFRNDNGIYALKGYDKLFMKLTYPFADVVIAQQEEMEAELLDFIPSLNGRVFTLHNYLDTQVVDKNLEEINPYTNPESIKYVWGGRVAKTKGQDILIHAFKIVHEKQPNSHLYLLGKYDSKDSFYKNLQKYIYENKISDYVHFEGLLKNPHIWIKYADCFVLPSRLEGLPNALVEALYIGTPCVAAECIPIIRRMIDEGRNGYVVPVEAPEALAEAMIKAIELKNCHSSYTPASADEYRKLF